jgi:predicted acetyltransferase
MLQQLIEISKQKGYPIIMLNASEMGKALYKKFGFKDIQNGMILNAL